MAFDLYRAMCVAESEKSISSGRPHFIRRQKWFSPCPAFVTNRVQDGFFNNSNFKPARYAELLVFTFSDESIKFFEIENEKEYRMDRRMEPMIQCEKVRRLECQRQKRNSILSPPRCC